MCGIVGYIGQRTAQPILLSCLKKLEYRGYDSCGIAISDTDLTVCKDAVRVDALAKAAPRFAGVVGIGHTRWATHGGPSQVNAHPHVDCSGKIAVVHNGIIANFRELKQQLTREGHEFTSETDTEVIPHLVEKYFSGDLEAAVAAALRDVEGSYAIVVLHAGEQKIVVARKDSPLVIGIGDRENFVASDVPAFLEHTNRVMYLEDGHIGVLTGSGVRIKSNGHEVPTKEERILWSAEEAQKSGYDHFMLKEIHEQPKVIRNTLAEYTRSLELTAGQGAQPLDSEPVMMLACGTSYHASLIGKYAFEELLNIPLLFDLASEFNHQKNTLGKGLAIAVSQSGETADTLKAMKRLKSEGSRVIAITNVVGSNASRIAHQTIYTHAGPEISVCATKSFTAQIMVLYWLAMSYAKIDPRRLAALLLELRQLPARVQEVLDNEAAIAECARYLSRFEHVFFIGRGINYPVALEGALKMKEVSYIHAEGYAAGEIKHGPFALLSTETPVIAIVGRDATYESMLTNMKEIKARGAPVIALTEGDDEAVEELCDSVITVPHVDPLFSPVVSCVVLQLLAYYAAKERACPIDFPRNLAKSVTVE